MRSLIPCMRVNYTIPQLFKALFINSKPGKNTTNLKTQICDYFNVDDVLLTSSARCALYLIFKSLPQKKVIIPAYTCEVVYDAACNANKEVIFAQVSKSTLNVSNYPPIDSDTIVIATHQYGAPCELERLSSMCRKVGAILIEDCAGSLGTIYENKLTGTVGDYGVFSFSASKTIQSPTKGGFIIAKNTKDLQKIELQNVTDPCSLRFKVTQILKGFAFCMYANTYLCSFMYYLRIQKNTSKNIPSLGASYRLGFYDWQAYIVSKQFAKIDTIINNRKKFFKIYDDGITNPHIIKPQWYQSASNIRYALLVKDREYFVKQCFAKGVEVDLGYKRSFCPNSFTEEKEIFKEIVYLPFGNNYSKKEIQKVVSVINQI